ncbi:Alpha/beta hydrolase family protein [Methyloligella halotolerans]|uniref:Alpha/beta hydrolase family protein n=1 Tax=Methyloligella halotolerans TaxID=1177755 RepID=A0A1E2S0G1_9HYPH|nr:alpha/beta hydrolase [Methyloligella halotolerans]ODA67809.1 Alpha/beta hydrolase family protein [Methyloligella halotolerans]
MSEDEPQFLELGPPRSAPDASARRIAYRMDGAAGATAESEAPGLLWLSGFLSDMAGTKVAALADWTASRGLPFARFDFSAHGLSSGDVAQGSIGDWLEEAIAILERMDCRRVIVIGSSMGGWIALLLARHLVGEGKGDLLAGLVLIAPAHDMTETLMWEKLSPPSRQKLLDEGVYYAPSDYDAPYPISRFLIEEGRNHLLGGGKLDPGCPVRILQGMEDPDVPWRHAFALMGLLANDDVEIDLIKDGDHRLSRPKDLRRLERTLQGLVES